MMFGDIALGGARPAAPLGDPALSVVGVSRSKHGGVYPDLAVAAGEVLGLAGLEGSGQRPFCGCVPGWSARLPVGSGWVGASSPVTRTGGSSKRVCTSFPQVASRRGLIAGLSIAEHLELVGDHGSFMVDREAAAVVARDRIAEFSIKGSPATHADTLSGGNQQRLLMAMAPDDPTLLLMEHPTRGLDLGSAEWVWDRLLRSRTGGQRSFSHRLTSRSCCDTAIASPSFSRAASSRSCPRKCDPVIPGSAHRWSDAVKRMRSVPLAIGIGIVATILLLLAVGAPPPLEALQVIFDGAFGNTSRISATLMAWVPLVLAAAGLLITFQAGVWNIGVEGRS